MFYHDTVQVIRAGTRTLASGDVQPDWSDNAVTVTTVEGVSVQPADGTETEGVDRNVVTDALRCQTRPGVVADVTAYDRVRIVGKPGTYDVIGRPAQYRDPITGTPRHTVWTMRKRVSA